MLRVGVVLRAADLGVAGHEADHRVGQRRVRVTVGLGLVVGDDRQRSLRHREVRGGARRAVRRVAGEGGGHAVGVGTDGGPPQTHTGQGGDAGGVRRGRAGRAAVELERHGAVGDRGARRALQRGGEGRGAAVDAGHVRRGEGGRGDGRRVAGNRNRGSRGGVHTHGGAVAALLPAVARGHVPGEEGPAAARRRRLEQDRTVADALAAARAGDRCAGLAQALHVVVLRRGDRCCTGRVGPPLDVAVGEARGGRAGELAGGDDLVGRHEPVGEVERVGDGAGVVGDDVRVPLPRPALVVVHVDVDGLAGLPVAARQLHQRAGRVVVLVALDPWSRARPPRPGRGPGWRTR